MPDDVDLTFVPSEDLIQELSRRYDGLIVAREKFVTDESCDTMFDFNGGISRAIGLAERLKRRLLSIAENCERGADAEDV